MPKPSTTGWVGCRSAAPRALGILLSNIDLHHLTPGQLAVDGIRCQKKRCEWMWREKELAYLLVTRAWSAVSRLAQREEGQDMIEYALLISLITIPLILAILAIGPYIQNTFQDAANALATAH